jgi:hypothetical protein
MANVAVLLFRVRPEVFCVFAAPLARAEQRSNASACRDGRHGGDELAKYLQAHRLCFRLFLEQARG